MNNKTIRRFVNTLRESKKKKKFFSRRKNIYGISKEQIKKTNRLGFTPEEYVIFNLEHNDPNEYITSYERKCFSDSIKKYRILFDNKIAFYHLAQKYVKCNTIYAYKLYGKYSALETGYEQENITVKLKETKAIVYKLIDSARV